jgi:hypothetical protein
MIDGIDKSLRNAARFAGLAYLLGPLFKGLRPSGVAA